MKRLNFSCVVKGTRVLSQGDFFLAFLKIGCYPVNTKNVEFTRNDEDISLKCILVALRTGQGEVLTFLFF